VDRARVRRLAAVVVRDRDRLHEFAVDHDRPDAVAVVDVLDHRRAESDRCGQEPSPKSTDYAIT
jgi:hypothetical protein